ncbi:hypothetical protein AOQ84DRAFT_383945 [Glonium stellatum]|uniref:Uncharacterized protein n=1 Tax=Glonium stellatum TaxID=574774 RepID=A0A8E2EMA2_9PEZI|nr:hypothetical protein AOQ84DRAFT_383945 [Glonium stellatum]
MLYTPLWKRCSPYMVMGKFLDVCKMDSSPTSRVPNLEKLLGYTSFVDHICLAVVVKGCRIVIGPAFMGAEPDRIAEGPHAGLRLFKTEELLSSKLMQSLPPGL